MERAHFKLVVLARRLATWVACAGFSLGMAPAAFACPFPPPPVQNLELTRFYTDSAGSKTDPALLEQHKDQTAPVRNYLKTVTGEADASFIQETESLGIYRARCALEWLEVWARGDAILGRVIDKQSSAERRWTLAGAALAYLKVKPAASAQQAQVIEAWLAKIARAARGDFERDGSKHNNHWYWLGLGLGATAVATGDEAMWTAARGIMQEAANAITADGTLPLELAREARALHYHAFALMPLTALAELARARGENWYAFGDGALHRLVAVTVQGIEHRELFKRLSGFDQEQPVNMHSGWFQLYRLERPQDFANVRFELPTGHYWLGGNVLLLDAALMKRRADPG